MTFSTSSWYSWAVRGEHAASRGRQWLQRGRRRTGVARLGEHLGQELGEVGEVLAEEVCLKHKGFPGVVGQQLTAEKLGLTGDAESGALVGVLRAGSKLAHLVC
jgi:hypothetical protein